MAQEQLDEQKLASAIAIAEEAQAQRNALESQLAEEQAKSKAAREAVALSDQNIRGLNAKLNDLKNLNHQEGALLLQRCRDFTDSLRRRAQDILAQAKEELHQAVTQRQQNDDRKKRLDEKEALLNSKGKEVFEKIRVAELESKSKLDAANKECGSLLSKKSHVEKELQAVSALVDSKKKLVADLEQTIASLGKELQDAKAKKEKPEQKKP